MKTIPLRVKAWRTDFILVNGKFLMSFKGTLRPSDLCFKVTVLL